MRPGLCAHMVPILHSSCASYLLSLECPIYVRTRIYQSKHKVRVKTRERFGTLKYTRLICFDLSAQARIKSPKSCARSRLMVAWDREEPNIHTDNASSSYQHGATPILLWLYSIPSFPHRCQSQHKKYRHEAKTEICRSCLPRER